MYSKIMLTDSYKFSHWKQYPPETKKIYSYFESRVNDIDSVFFGLQYILKTYFEGQFVFNEDQIKEGEEMCDLHFGQKGMFNSEGWKYILHEYGGKLPLEIKAIPEGTLVNPHNALITILNTDDKCFWLPNYMETLCVQTWYMTTVASKSFAMKKDILSYLKRTGTPELIDFKLHDFGFRGVSSVETAACGAAAHMTCFKGTDTFPGLILLKDIYNESMAGFSVPASEHSTICSWGKHGETKAYENMLDSYPNGYVACVSDSYDVFNACENLWGRTLKDKVMNRNGTLVIRLDSGDPIEVIDKALNILGIKFGYSTNEKGFRVLPDCVRIIQGDGINAESIKKILFSMMSNGWSSDNITFGSGGALLQKMNRDTLNFAFKCSARLNSDNEWEDVYKNPITDPGKVSKRGRLKVVKDEDGKFKTIKLSDENNQPDELVTVFKDGEIVKKWSLKEIRDRVNSYL